MPLPPILHEDDALIAFDKPAGLPVAPERGRKGATLIAEVQAKFGAGVANVHRLDTDASGVLLCAKTKPALDFLSGQFQSKTADKRHLALVVLQPADRAVRDLVPLRTGGDLALPDAFTVDLAIREDEHEPGRMRVGGGRDKRDCATEFKVLERFGRFVWLECHPLTGRPHQVRLHLASLGAPVLNDALYGDTTVKLLLSDLKRGYKGRDEEKPLLARLALHANELTVKHPATREPFKVAAPLPHEFEIALKYLRKFGTGRSR